MKKHFLDKIILRNIFKNIVAEHKLKMFIANQKPLPPEFQKIINDNFWELLED